MGHAIKVKLSPRYALQVDQVRSVQFLSAGNLIASFVLHFFALNILFIAAGNEAYLV